jgi:hypothetical protein
MHDAWSTGRAHRLLACMNRTMQYSSRGGERICRGHEHAAPSGIDTSGLIGLQLVATSLASCVQLPALTAMSA